MRGVQEVARPSLPGVEQLDQRLGVRLARHLLRGDDTPLLDDPAPHDARQVDVRVVRSDGLVGLRDPPVAEEVLVGPASRRVDDEQQQPGRHPVQPVRGAQRRQPEPVAEADEHGLAHVAAAGDRGEEVRLVDDDDLVVAVHDVDVERHRRLVGEIAVEPHHRPRHERRRGTQRAVVVDDAPLGEHRVDPGGRHRQPLDEVVAQRRPRPLVGHPHPRRVEPVALGERGVATGHLADPTAGQMQRLRDSSARDHVQRRRAADRRGSRARARWRHMLSAKVQARSRVPIDEQVAEDVARLVEDRVGQAAARPIHGASNSSHSESMLLVEDRVDRPVVVVLRVGGAERGVGELSPRRRAGRTRGRS